jgi:phosphate transport system substrate-binding protein
VHAALRVAGSDLLGLDFSKAVYDFAARSGARVALAFDGSRPGAEALRLGRADLGLLVLPAEEFEPLAAFRRLPLAYQRVLVLVPGACPLEQVSIEQLARIFGADSGSGTVRWGDLGVQGGWGTSAVSAMAPEAGAGLALELFRHAVLGGRGLKPNLQRYRTAAELSAEFGRDSTVMALASELPADLAGAKVVPIVVASGQPALFPTPENLHAGRYPLRLSLQVVYPADKAAALGPLLRFLFSEEAALVLARAGLAALPVGARADQLRRLDAL